MLRNIFDFIKNLFPYKIPQNSEVYVVMHGKKKRLKRKLPGLTLIVEGHNHYVEIELPIKFKNTTIHLSGENAVFIMKKTGCIVNNASIYVGSWGRCLLGENIQLNQPNFKVVINNNQRGNPHTLVIGKNAQIGRDISIRTSDGHAIFNKGEKLPYNEPEDVIIGDDVWIAQRAVILKGSKISSNSIIGACSLVNKKFEEEGVIIAGNPAKIIKRNISWSRETYGFHMNKHCNVYGDAKNIKSIIRKKIRHKLLKLKFKFYF